MKNKNINDLILKKLKEEKLLNEFNFKSLFTSAGKELINAESALANNLVKLSNTINTSAKSIDSLIEKFENTRENLSEGDFAILQSFLVLDQDLDRKKTLQKVLNDINAIVKDISPQPWFQKLGISEKALFRLGIISVACKMAGQETEAKPQESEEEKPASTDEYDLEPGTILPFQKELSKDNNFVLNGIKFIVLESSERKVLIQGEKPKIVIELSNEGKKDNLFNYKILSVKIKK